MVFSLFSVDKPVETVDSSCFSVPVPFSSIILNIQHEYSISPSVIL